MASDATESLNIPILTTTNSISTDTSLELSAVEYAQLYGLFVPLHRLDPISYLEVERDYSYWTLNAEDDSVLEPFYIRHVTIAEDETEADGYAEHIISGDITPVDGDSVTSFVHTVLEHTVKFPVPILHATSSRDMARYLRARAKFQAFDFDDFVLPHEPTNDDKDEGMVFSQDSTLFLAALEGDTELEQPSFHVADAKGVDELLSGLQHEEPLEPEAKPIISRRVRIISPPISPVIRPTELFVPWQEVSRVETPDSDVPSLLEADLAVAEAVVEKIFDDAERHPDAQDTINLALRLSSSASKSPTPSAHPFHLKIDPPALRPISPLTDSAIFSMDLKDELNVATRAVHSSSPHKAESERTCDVILDHDLNDVCNKRAQSINMAISQERLSYHNAALLMTAPVLNFSRPAPSWSAAFSDALQCVKHIMQLFSATFDMSRIKLRPDILPSGLTWRPWPSMTSSFNMIEAIEYDTELLRNALAFDHHVESNGLWNPTPKLSFLDKSCIDSDIDLSYLPDRSDVPEAVTCDASSTFIPEAPRLTPHSRHTSKFFSSSSSRLQHSSPSVPSRRAPSISKDHTFLATPNTSSPAKPKPPKVSISVAKKRGGDLLDDILALKRLKKLPSLTNQAESGSLLAHPSGANLAGQHLTNFMNIMNLGSKKTSKFSKFFSISASAPSEKSSAKEYSASKHHNADIAISDFPLARQTQCLPAGSQQLVSSFVVSISLGVKLIRLIRKLQPGIKLIDRDYSKYSVTVKDAVSGLAQASPTAISLEADVSVSPITGLVVIGLASFAGSSVKARLQQLSRLYDQLIVLVCQRESSSGPSAEDVTTYAGISSFSASLPNRTRCYLIGSDEEAVAGWMVKFLVDYQEETARVSGLLSVDEHSWERLFRLCGLNVCAAQALAKTLEQQYGEKGLMAFLKMDIQDRVSRFSALLGSKRRVEVLSTQLFQKWT